MILNVFKGGSSSHDLVREIGNAAESGDLKRVETLLKEAPELVNSRIQFWSSDQNVMPLHRAASKGHVDMVKMLVDKGAEVNAQTSGGSTALHFASYNGEPELVKILLDKGANVNVWNAVASTPLNAAASCGHVETVKLLLANGAEVNNQIPGAPWRDYTPLHSAALGGHVEVVRVLLEKGAKVNSLAARGETPLQLAESRGNIEVVKILSSMGTEVDAGSGSAARVQLAMRHEYPKPKTTRSSNSVAHLGTMVGLFMGFVFTFSGIMVLASSIILAKIGVNLIFGPGTLVCGVLSVFSVFSFRRRENRNGGLLLVTGLLIFIITIAVSLVLE